VFQCLQAFKKAALLYKSKSSIPVSLWNNIGCLALRLNRSAEALTAFTHAAKISNAPLTVSNEPMTVKHVTLYFNLARAYEMSGQFSQAVAIFEKISADHPSYVDADLRLASIHKQKGQWSEAFAKMKNVLSKNQMNVDAQAMYGLYLLESGNAEPAQKQLEHYLKLHETHKQTSNKEQHAHKIAYLKLLLADVCLERYAVLEHAHAAAKSAAAAAAAVSYFFLSNLFLI
jgi:RNA polymerase-associated protein CTR9